MRHVVAFQGETGAFSEGAARLLVDRELALLPCSTFDAAVRAVVDGHADYAAMPIHNLIAGPVHASIDAMARFSSIERVREVDLPIRLALLGLPGARVDDIREVLSHGVALRQVTKFLADHPAIRAVEAHDTAGAARLVAIRRDASVAAVAAPWVAKMYGLAIIAEGLEDHPENRTTFALIRRKRQSM